MKCKLCLRFVEGVLKPELGSLCPYWDHHREEVVLPKGYFDGKFCNNFKGAK